MEIVERVKAKVKLKDSEKEKLRLMDEMQRVSEEMGIYREEQKTLDVNTYTPFTPAETKEPEAEVHTGEVLPQQVIHITADELAKIIAAAKGDYIPVEREPLPPDAPLTAKVADFTGDAVGEVGRGAHRMVDGCREVLAGAIDIVTLGRAHRR